MNSENFHSRESQNFEKKVSTSRNPLGNICPNVVRPEKEVKVRKVFRSVSTITKIERSEEKSRSNSSSTVETQVKFCFKSKNVEHENSEDEDNEVFEEEREKCVNYLSEFKQERDEVHLQEKEKIDQAVPGVDINLPTGENVENKRPAQKTTLMRKLTERQRRCREEEFYENCLYDVIYFQENYKFILKQEKKYVYRKDFLKRYIDHNFRVVTINWLNYVHKILGVTEHTFLMGVRMLDFIILKLKSSAKRYVLLGLVCLWIANKHLDVRHIQVSKLFALCNGKYPYQEFVVIEKEVLKALEFDVNFPEPLTFLFYYLKNEQMENNSKVRCGAQFLLEIFTLLLDFSSLQPSLLACVALHLALIKYKFNESSFVEYINEHLMDEFNFLHLSKHMETNVTLVLKCQRACNEIVEKYSTENKFKVAYDFLSE